MSNPYRIMGAACALLLFACAPALQQEARLENKSVPDGYLGQGDAANAAQMKWSEFFTDAKLDALIDTALQNNQELNIVSIEIDIARNEIMTREGEFLPKLDFKVGAGLEKASRYTSKGASDEAHGVPEHTPDFAFGFSASWEIDVWSKLRNATKAATLRYLASEEGRRFAVSVLVGEVADAYYELIALDAQLEVLQQNIAVQQNALEVVRLQKEAAKVSELAVKRFEAEVLKNQSRQYVVQQEVYETENRINFLVGRFPQHVDRTSENFINLQPVAVHEGIPSQLLQNRPDIRKAELELEANKLDVQVAKASFYPRLGIGANIGYQSFDVTKLVATPASLLYSLGADIMVPLLNRKGLTAAYYTANSIQLQAVYRYERALLKGFTEVANRLQLIHNLKESEALRRYEVDALIQSIDISSRLFASARADYMEVLLTRRDALESQIELIEIKRKQMNAMVGLYQALGGGWR